MRDTIRGEIHVARREERQDLLPDLLEELAVGGLPYRVLVEAQILPLPVRPDRLRALVARGRLQVSINVNFEVALGGYLLVISHC